MLKDLNARIDALFDDWKHTPDARLDVYRGGDYDADDLPGVINHLAGEAEYCARRIKENAGKIPDNIAAELSEISTAFWLLSIKEGEDA